MAKRFHYFDINGLGESIRYMLHYGGVKFEDVRHTHENWAKEKQTTPFGQLPLYEDGDKGTLNQSLAIAQYVGQSLGLVAGDPWKDAQLLATALTFNDFWAKTLEWFKTKDEEEKAAKKKALMTEHLDFYFSRFEKQLKDNNGFFGGKLTWVDFVVTGLVEVFTMFSGENIIEKKYPSFKALADKIHANPGVKSYVASRPQYKLPSS